MIIFHSGKTFTFTRSSQKLKFFIEHKNYQYTLHNHFNQFNLIQIKRPMVHPERENNFILQSFFLFYLFLMQKMHLKNSRFISGSKVLLQIIFHKFFIQFVKKRLNLLFEIFKIKLPKKNFQTIFIFFLLRRLF